ILLVGYVDIDEGIKEIYSDRIACRYLSGGGGGGVSVVVTGGGQGEEEDTQNFSIERPLMLEKGNYIPWESRFRRFLDNKLEEGDRIWRSFEKGPYVRPMIPNPDKPTEQILEPLSKMTEGNKKQYITDVRVMNYLL
ncbi:hypothetical protein Tco_0920557, partial [Tanacetum coccineum]